MQGFSSKLSFFLAPLTFSMMKKVSKKSRQNDASTRSTARQELLQNQACLFWAILSLAVFTPSPARRFALPARIILYAIFWLQESFWWTQEPIWLFQQALFIS